MIKSCFSTALTIVLSGVFAAAWAGEGGSDGFAGGPAPGAPGISWFHAPGADQLPAATTAPSGSPNEYRFVAGSTLTPRNNLTTVGYEGGGCVTASNAITTDLQLPDGAMILGVRIYYYDNGSPGAVTGFLTRYDGAGSFEDILTADSTLETGYASEYFALATPEAYDASYYSHVLTARTDTGIQICGFRVFYTAP